MALQAACRRISETVNTSSSVTGVTAGVAVAPGVAAALAVGVVDPAQRLHAETLYSILETYLSTVPLSSGLPNVEDIKLKLGFIAV